MSLLASSPSRRVPAFDLADRMRKAAREADLSNGYLAETLHVSESTISGWLNGAHRPPKLAQMMFAAICDVDEEWLVTGTPSSAVTPATPSTGRRMTRSKTRTSANHRPVD
jgi:transcriptional regulator with XRE-family HTH domain